MISETMVTTNTPIITDWKKMYKDAYNEWTQYLYEYNNTFNYKDISTIITNSEFCNNPEKFLYKKYAVPASIPTMENLDPVYSGGTLLVNLGDEPQSLSSQSFTTSFENSVSTQTTYGFNFGLSLGTTFEIGFDFIESTKFQTSIQISTGFNISRSFTNTKTTEQTYIIPSQRVVVPPHSAMEVGVVFGNARKKGVVDLFLEFGGTDTLEGFVCYNNNNIQTLSGATMPLYLAGQFSTNPHFCNSEGLTATYYPGGQGFFASTPSYALYKGQGIYTANYSTYMDVIVKPVALPLNTSLESFLEKKRAEGIKIQIIDKSNNNPTTGLEDKDGNIYYYNDGTQVTNTWENINSQGMAVQALPNRKTVNAYYFGSNGAAEKGLQIIDGKIQYLNPNTGKMEFDKFITINGNTYYLQPINGQGAIGWQIINEHKYYFNSNGIMQTGMQYIDGFVYYFNSQGIMQTGVQKIDGLHYYFNPSTGRQEAGVCPTLEGLEYFTNNPTGNEHWGQAIYYVGWLTLGNNKYYFGRNSKAMTGWQTIDGHKYYFNTTTGVLENN